LVVVDVQAVAEVWNPNIETLVRPEGMKSVTQVAESGLRAAVKL
jgi:hypothetical protein